MLQDGSIEEDNVHYTTTGGDCSSKDNLEPKLDSSPFQPMPIAVEQDISRRASRTILQWITMNGDGTPSEGIYQDEWVRDYLFDDDSSSDLSEEPDISDGE